MSLMPLVKNNWDIKRREWKINAELKFARTIIPIPPNHWSSDLQINIPSDKFSKLLITVAPVVVIPLTDSKKASVYESEDDEYTNGIAPKRDITNQDEIVNKNACRIPSLISFFLNEKYKIIPIKNVIKLE